MSTPEDPRQGDGQEGWQPQGWQSEWQRPGGWRQEGEGASQPQPAGQWMQAGVQRTSGKSTAALVLGILGLVLFCPIVFSILALIFGYQSRREIDASGGTLGGRGNATVGIVLGWVGVGLMVVFLVLIVIGFAVGDVDSGSSAPVSATPA